MPTANEKAAPLLGAEIRRLRKERGLTLRQLADAVDLDFGYLGKIERGENARVETYRAIVAELGITLADLMAVLDAKGRRTVPRRSAAHAVQI